MAFDSTTMAVISTIVTMIGATGGGILTYVKSLHSATVQELRSHNERLDKRAEECEADRKELHHRINEQSERITSISSQLAKWITLASLNPDCSKCCPTETTVQRLVEPLAHHS